MVVADFGLATRAVSEKGSNPRDPADNPHAGVQTAHSHSQHTQNVGTELYRAPEQSGNHYDEKVDVFALGIMFVELLYPITSLTKMERLQLLTDARQAHASNSRPTSRLPHSSATCSPQTRASS